MKFTAGNTLTQTAPGRISRQHEPSPSSPGSPGPAYLYKTTPESRHIVNTGAVRDSSMNTSEIMLYNGGAFAIPKAASNHEAVLNVNPTRTYQYDIIGQEAATKPQQDRSMLGNHERVNNRRRGFRSFAKRSDEYDSLRWTAAYRTVPNLDRSETGVPGVDLCIPSYNMSSSPTASETALELPQGSLSPRGTLPGCEHQFQPYPNLSMRQANSRNTHPPKTTLPPNASPQLLDDSEEFRLFPRSSDAALEFNDFGNTVMPARLIRNYRTDTRVEQMLFSAPQAGFDVRMLQEYTSVSRSAPMQVATMASLEELSNRVRLREGAEKPAAATNSIETYSCTYHGCSLQFESQARLRNHRREFHCQSQNSDSPKSQDVMNAMSSQEWPYLCERINPSTGNPCHSIFSRPYELTRHADAVHNARKMRARCDLCIVEKTFSRRDALKRHYRLCHPDVDLPRRRRHRA